MQLNLAMPAFVAFLLAAHTVSVAAVYRWVDEQGKVHYSEVVPERYRKTAKPIDVTAGQPSAEQQREALERAQKEKARAAAANQGGASASVKPSGASSAAASRLTAKRPAQIPTEQTDCESWQRLYLESTECFGPYRTVRGATKPEAFDVCNVVPAPPPRCRPRIP